MFVVSLITEDVATPLARDILVKSNMVPKYVPSPLKINVKQYILLASQTMSYA